jgi:hypothetical protein
MTEVVIAVDSNFWRLTLEQLSETLSASVGFSNEQIKDTQQLRDDPEFVYTEGTIWAVRGKRP